MSKLKTPEILWSASRQFRHNNSDDFINGFDYEKTVQIVNSLENLKKDPPLPTLLLSRKLGLPIQESQSVAVEFLRFALDKRYSNASRGTGIHCVFDDFKFMSGIDLQSKV